MKKILLGLCTGLVVSASMNVAAFQSIPEAELARFNQEIQREYQGVGLTEEQTKALLNLKADLQRYNASVAEVHGHDDHSLNILQRVNLDKYNRGVDQILTEQQQKELQIQRRGQLYAQVPAPDMARFEKEVQDETRVMELSEAQSEQLLDLKVGLFLKLEAASAEHAGNKRALNEARRICFDGYMAGLNQLITNEQLDTLNAWRRAGMPENFKRPNA